MIFPWPIQVGELERLAAAKGQILSPSEAMSLAIAVARRGAGFVSPNPMVGCVILDREHRLLSMGYHEKFGGPHAEVRAVQNFEQGAVTRDQLARAAHFFVSLEPCSHFGKTPPCADLLVGINPLSVTAAILDPNPRVSGSGLARIRQQGIASGSLEEMTHWPSMQGMPIEPDERNRLIALAQDLVEVFLHSQIDQASELPFTILKLASTLDGRVAMRSGESKWITGPAARDRGRELRKEADLVITTARTFLNDNPKLNSEGRGNRVAILDASDFSAAKVLSRDDATETVELFKVRRVQDILLVADQKLPKAVLERIEAKGIEVRLHPGLTVLSRPDRLEFVLKDFRKSGVRSCYLEGGSALVSSALQGSVGVSGRSGLVHRVHQFVNASYLGGVHAKSFTKALEISDLHDRLKLSRVRVELLGASGDPFSSSADLHLTGVLPLALPLFGIRLSQQGAHLQGGDSETAALG